MSTGAPLGASAYTNLHVVGDLVALLDAVAQDQDKVFVVGPDWGAIIAWALCLYRPDKVTALVNMSVVFTRRSPKWKPLAALHATYGNDYYICRFQEPGEIEAEFAEMGTKRVLKNFLTYRNPGPLFLPKGKGFGDSPDTPIALPSWLSEEDVDYYATKYEQTGFTGGLNYYRALDLTWELAAPWTGVQVAVPVKFIAPSLSSISACKHTLKSISELASSILPDGGWPKLLPFMFQCVTSDNPKLRESALLIFAQLAQYIGETLIPHLDTLHTVFIQCLLSTLTFSLSLG
ncbi:hypothetical protein CsSME_00023543 [Camellia sinensis var. sinensis]